MALITLPANGWRPRDYQLPAWSYLEGGGKHAELIWPRRHGKDEICLHFTACAAIQRPAVYWHMLPQKDQARKAIWTAVNPHTGRRRIDDAFPKEIRKRTLENEMMIEFINGSVWQVVGSDNYDSLVGVTLGGIIYSEWSRANPAARAYLRPIIMESKGWQIFITTPKGKNHAYTTFNSAMKDPNCFAQRITALESGTFTPMQLEAERRVYVDDYGPDMGNALFEQEYLCSFDAAILGAIYGAELRDAAPRITQVPHDPSLPVHAVMDMGWSDDTAILFFQVARGEVRLIDAYATHGQTISHYSEVMRSKPYKYGQHLWLPHDARAKSIQTGRSAEEQFRALGWQPRIVPELSIQDGINAVRKTFPQLWINSELTDFLSAIGQYQREWDDNKKMFMDRPRHDWTSHYADALRYLALVWREEMVIKEAPSPIFPAMQSFEQMRDRAARARRVGI